MKILRVILFGALLWILIFFEVSILMFGLKLEINAIYYAVHYLLLVILTGIIALLYFRKAKRGFAQGILTGIIFMLVSLILDAIITVPLFIEEGYAFFLDAYLWLGVLISVLVVGLVGLAKK